MKRYLTGEVFAEKRRLNTGDRRLNMKYEIGNCLTGFKGLGLHMIKIWVKFSANSFG